MKNEGDLRKGMMYPNKNDILGVVVKNYGQTRMNVKCQDGETRICRVRGKMKKRRWVREGDVVLVSPWDFQSKERRHNLPIHQQPGLLAKRKQLPQCRILANTPGRRPKIVVRVLYGSLHSKPQHYNRVFFISELQVTCNTRKHLFNVIWNKKRKV